MARFRQALMHIIREYQLDFRFPEWKTQLFMLDQGMYTDSFCEVLLTQAKLDAEKVLNQGNFLWRPPEIEELYGGGKPDIEIGSLKEGDQPLRCGIRYKDRPKNILIMGSAGSGKTVAARGICINIDRINQSSDDFTSLIVVDPKADNTDLSERLSDEVLTLSPYHNLKLGLNGPKDAPPSMWIGQMSLSLAQRLGLIVARTCLAQITARLLVSLNPGLVRHDLNDATVSKDLVWPSFEMVLDAMKTRGVLEVFSSKADYGKTLIQALSGLIQDAGPMIDCCNGLDVNEEIIQKKRHCVLNVSNTPAYVIHLINDTFINQILVRRLFNNYRCEHTDAAFIYDEFDILAESDFPAGFSDGLTPLDRLNRLGREPGLMSVISASSPQSASEHILRNAFYTMAFKMTDSESMYYTGRMLQLDPRCQRMLSSLSPGQCIFKQTEASWSHAFLCQVDYVSPRPSMAPVEYKPHPYKPAVKLADMPQVIADLEAAVNEHEKGKNRRLNESEKTLGQLGLELLRLGISKPYVPVVRLFEQLGKTRFEVQQKVRLFLEQEHYAEFEEPRIGSKNLLLMDVTSKGYEISALPAPRENKGRGGISHRHFAHWIRFHFEHQGKEAILEWIVPGTNHPVDLAVNLGHSWEVFEICVSSADNLVSHIQACFAESNAVERLTVVAGTKKQLNAIKSMIQANKSCSQYLKKIGFETITKYMTTGA